MAGQSPWLIGHLGRVAELEQLSRIWLGALLRKLDRCRYRAIDLLLEPRQAVVVEDALLGEALRRLRDRVLRPDLLQIVGGAITVRIDHRVALESEALDVQHAGHVFSPRALDRF